MSGDEREVASTVKAPGDDGDRDGAGQEETPVEPSTRRKILLIALPPLFSLIGLVGIIFWEIRHPPQWQTELDGYLARQAGEVEVVRVLTARFPELMRDSSPYVPIGDSPHYLTASDPKPVVGSDSRSPIPFPPTEVWCFLLRRGSEDLEPANELSTLLIARHQDLYNGDWLVYEPEPQASSAAVEAVLRAIGCPLFVES